MEFGVGPDADSGVPPVLPGRLTEREFAAFLGPRNSVSGDRCGDAVGFSTLRKAAMQRTPTSCACSALNSFFVEGGAMNFIEKSAMATYEYWLREYGSCTKFPQ